MELNRLKQLAGVPKSELDIALSKLDEVVEIPEDITIEQLVERLDACKRALSIVHKLQNPADKKKWMSATFVNLNKVRGALQRMLAKLDTANNVTDDAVQANNLANNAPK